MDRLFETQKELILLKLSGMELTKKDLVYKVVETSIDWEEAISTLHQIEMEVQDVMEIIRQTIE